MPDTGRSDTGRSLLLLVALTAAVFSPSLSGDFIEDDASNIVENTVLDHPFSWPRLLYDAKAQTRDARLVGHIYRPLSALSYALQLAGGADTSFPFHLIDILLHAAATCLVFLLARRLARSEPAAWGAAVLFCLHPAQAESVAYISGARPNGLSLVLCLAAFWLYLDGKRRASWALYALALLSKESAVFLPAALAAHDLALGPARERWRARAERWATYAALAGGFLVIRALVLGRVAQRGLWGGSAGLHAALAARGLGADLAIALWPARLRACYSFVEGPGFAVSAWVSTAAVAAMAAAALYGLRRRRLEGFALAWALAALAPVSNLVPLFAFSADRFLHAPLAGFAWAAAAGLARLRGREAALAAAAVALALAPLCLERQLDWRGDFQLSYASYAAAPDDPCTALRLARFYYGWGMLGRAETLLARADVPGRLQPRVLEALALTRLRQGRPSKALADIDRAIALAPDLPGLAEVRRSCLASLPN